MPTIELSPALYTAAMPRIWRLGDITPSITNYAESGILPLGGAIDSGHVFSQIYLHSGTMPTTWVANPITTYNLNRMIAWDCGTHFSATVGAVTVSTTTTINTLYKAAALSGTATWFMIVSRNKGDAIGTPYQEIIGTVGLTGSGADLELADANIVAGRAYKISNLRITLPGSWTY